MKGRGLIAGTAGIVVLTAAALRGVLRRFAVVEASMRPTLEEGDWLIARRRTGVPERGAIVVLQDPTGSGINLVKRVIGVPGERMGVEGGRVTVNGALLADRWASGITTSEGVWDVPDGHVWILGDNRSASASDSRVLGPIPVTDIPWVVVARYWPKDRVAMLG